MKVWEGKRFSVEVEDGREIARSRDAVSILAVDAQDRVLLVRQKRPAAGKELLELPAGLIDEGEAPLATARRSSAFCCTCVRPPSGIVATCASASPGRSSRRSTGSR